MRGIFLVIAVGILCPVMTFAEELAKGEKQKTAQKLQDISVTIKAARGEGSGVIFTRKINNENVNFIWTAAHVVDSLRHTKSVIDSKTGTSKTVVEFDDASVIKAYNEDGRLIGKSEFFAEVVRFSAEEDLALLKVRKRNFSDVTAVFYLDAEIPPPGTALLHVGSLLGQMGSNSVTNGIMSQQGRLVQNKVFDQTTVTAFPGSSGGGVYLEDGRLVGLVLRGAGETFNLIAPVRRIHSWAKSANVEWALDAKIAMPSEDELKKLPVEDNGVSFSYSAVAADKKSVDKEFPTFFRLYNKDAKPNLFDFLK